LLDRVSRMPKIFYVRENDSRQIGSNWGPTIKHFQSCYGASDQQRYNAKFYNQNISGLDIISNQAQAY
jgi:hypothetical protein